MEEEVDYPFDHLGWSFLWSLKGQLVQITKEKIASHINLDLAMVWFYLVQVLRDSSLRFHAAIPIHIAELNDILFNWNIIF